MPQKFITVRDALEFAEAAFNEAQLYYGHGTDNAWDDAVALLIYVLDLPPDVTEEILPYGLSQQESEQLEKLFSARIEQRKPVAYLTQEMWFCGLPFYIDERVIIPRSPIAELIANQFQPWIDGDKVNAILDLCCGSACIGIACAYVFPKAKIDVADLSQDALAVAKINIEQHELSSQITLYHSDVFNAILDNQYDIIVSNPPYVDAKDMASMPPEYHHEPLIALASGHDGLDVTHQILKQAAAHLTDAGILICEVGNSAPALEKAYPKVDFMWLTFEHGGDGIFLLTKSQLLMLNQG